MTVDLAEQIANAEREAARGGWADGFRMLAQVTAYLLGRVEALEAEVQRAQQDTETSTTPTVDNHLHLFALNGLCSFPGCALRRSATEHADPYPAVGDMPRYTGS